MTNVKDFTLSDLTGRQFDSKRLVDRAFHFASAAHRNLKRDGGEPFIIHPLRVAIVLKKEFLVNDEQILAAALLHDTIEDTAVTREEIVQEFGENIANTVAVLTKNPELIKHKTTEGLRAYFEAIRIHPNPDVRRIKVVDRIDNLRDLSFWKPQRVAKYLDETMTFVLPIAQSIGKKEESALKHQWAIVNAMTVRL